MLHWPVAAAAAAASVQAIVIAAPSGKTDEALVVGRAAAGDAATVAAVEGGRERSDSVAAGLAQVTTPIVAVHDAARPLVSPEAFDALAAIVAAGEADGAILATPVFDTVKRAARDSGAHPPIAETVDRTGLWAAQTPQVFTTETLRQAYDAAGPRAGEATDDATLVEWTGRRVLLVPASGPNFKLTWSEDLALAEALLVPGTLYIRRGESKACPAPLSHAHRLSRPSSSRRTGHRRRTLLHGRQHLDVQTGRRRGGDRRSRGR